MACTPASTTILSSSSTSRAYIPPKSSSIASFISKPFSQNPRIPTSFNSHPKPLLTTHSTPSLFSKSPSHNTSSFVVGAGDLPLVGNVAPDFEAEAVFDQEFIKVKSSSTFPPLSRPRKTHNFPSLSTETTTTISTPPIPPKTPHKLLPENPNSEFQNKLVFLDSIGIDLISFLTTHPPIAATSIADIKSTVSFLYSVGLNSSDLRRAINMCPEIISSPVTTVVSALTFLLRDIGVEGRDLRQILKRRPRLLACSVENRLRPTQYFLQGTIGIADLRRHTHLLSCSVETKFIPRIDYFVEIGFSYRDTISMFRRFPALFCYSIEENLESKFNYFVVKMGRDLKELKEFPQYFSFSLENRIKPRHRDCVEKGVCLSLPNMLRSNDKRFRERLEVYCRSTMPVKTSPLWCTKHDDYSL